MTSSTQKSIILLLQCIIVGDFIYFLSDATHGADFVIPKYIMIYTPSATSTALVRVVAKQHIEPYIGTYIIL